MKQLTIRNRILASFGVILALMLVMAVCSYILLGAIDRDARSQEEDSSPGVYLANGQQIGGYLAADKIEAALAGR